MTLDFLKPFYVQSKIRAGRSKDGGYVIEEGSLASVDIIYSYGVGWEVSFEKDLSSRTKKLCRLFDPTMLDYPNLRTFWAQGAFYFLKFIAKAALWKPYMFFLKGTGYKLKFYNEGLAVTRKNKYDSFPNHVQRFGDQGKKIFLKIDIEGGEYEMFRDPVFLSSLKNVVQLAIEFHDVDKKLQDVKRIITTISDDLSLIHIHGNNWSGVFEFEGKQIPRVLELTFLNNSFLISKVKDQSDYPVEGVDFPNKIGVPDINLSSFLK